MKKSIEIKIEISNLHEWDVNWDNEIDSKEEVIKVKNEIKDAIIRYMGIDRNSVKIIDIDLVDQ